MCDVEAKYEGELVEVGMLFGEDEKGPRFHLLGTVGLCLEYSDLLEKYSVVFPYGKVSVDDLELFERGDLSIIDVQFAWFDESELNYSDESKYVVEEK